MRNLDFYYFASVSVSLSLLTYLRKLKLSLYCHFCDFWFTYICFLKLRSPYEIVLARTRDQMFFIFSFQYQNSDLSYPGTFPRFHLNLWSNTLLVTLNVILSLFDWFRIWVKPKIVIKDECCSCFFVKKLRKKLKKRENSRDVLETEIRPKMRLIFSID